MSCTVEKGSRDFNEPKKMFNKKRWREEKYSIKAKINQWNENRRKVMLKKYHKELKKNDININTKNDTIKPQKKLSNLKKAELEFKKKKEEELKKKAEQQRKNKERSEALLAYKEKKAAKFKILSQKNWKGQPVMKGRLQLLLEKIEKNYSQSR